MSATAPPRAVTIAAPRSAPAPPRAARRAAAVPLRQCVSERREAHEPPEARGLRRDEVRMLVAARGRDGTELTHARARDLPDHLRAGDVLVINTSATLPAALPARRADGTLLRLHLSTPAAGEQPGRWVVELRRETSASAADAPASGSRCPTAQPRRCSRPISAATACGSRSSTRPAPSRAPRRPRGARTSSPRPTPPAPSSRTTSPATVRRSATPTRAASTRSPPTRPPSRCARAARRCRAPAGR